MLAGFPRIGEKRELKKALERCVPVGGRRGRRGVLITLRRLVRSRLARLSAAPRGAQLLEGRQLPG